MTVTFEHRTLDNGLTILGEVDPAAHTAAAGFFVRTGARDEDAALMGVSHFLEHMMFKGTGAISADELSQRFDRIGARNNAYTTAELTCFYAQVLPEYLGEALDLLGQMMRPALRQGDFDTEKGVILEEIAMYRDNPFWVLYEATMEHHYGPHPLGHRVLGTEATVGAMTQEGMRAYFEQRYAADSTVVALAGRVDFEREVRKIRELCGDWAATNVQRAYPEAPGDEDEFEIRDDSVNRGYLLMLSSAPAIDDDRRYAMTLLSQVLGASDNSRLHWKLIETGLAEEAQAGYDPHDGVGDAYVYASGDPEKLGEIREVIDHEIAGLVDSLTGDDLERLRCKLATAITLGGERPGDRMQRLGRLWTYQRRHRSLEEELERINAVTLDDLRETFEAFPLTPRTIGVLRPGGASAPESGG